MPRLILTVVSALALSCLINMVDRDAREEVASVWQAAAAPVFVAHEHNGERLVRTPEKLRQLLNPCDPAIYDVRTMRHGGCWNDKPLFKVDVNVSIDDP